MKFECFLEVGRLSCGEKSYRVGVALRLGEAIVTSDGTAEDRTKRKAQSPNLLLGLR
jgi:hypothetical protein